ncbi:Uncharacterized protein GcM3_119001 [Golovinomyces cichoracearum]|uniref:LysM domain-containing protein n=1 Tax=Golovinomyces cichoracearum TaxID=62708 RepID=A0A420I772_9PEZI|nr:Uncharacterized protein GcM3_119001 [Golovinomyces cichoracearum]
MSPYSGDNSSGSNLAPPTVNPISQQYSIQGSLSNSGIRSRNKILRPSRHKPFSTSATSTPGGSRAVSPNPPRTPNHNGEVVRSSKSGMEGCEKISKKIFDSGSSMKGLWDGSWASYGLNTLQEIVFTSIADTTDSDSRWAQVHKKQDWFGKGKGKAQNEWGPETRLQQNKAEIGIGNTENRGDKLKDLKRTQMLEGRDDIDSKVDETKTYKQRTSFQDFRSETLEEDNFTLVYVHIVQPQDTIQGVVLKFHSQMDVIKKANRFWSGDSIQLREKVFLPVDACAIKGKPCPPPQIDSLSDLGSLAPTSELSESPYQDYGAWINGKSANYPGNSKNNDENESPFIHVRWVLLESSSSIPVEVVRIPRKTLNYFPPRRRKSIASASVSSTPRISLDMPSLCRSSTDSQRNSPSQRLSVADRRSSPVITTSTLSKQLSLSNSRESFSEINDRRGWLQGPGGVGTLGKNVRRPGPAKDVLNSWTRKKFPGIAIDSLPSSSAVDAESAKLSFIREDVGPTAADSILTHQLSENSCGGLAFPNMNLNSVENWVRKIASKVQVPHNLKEDSIEMLDGAGSYDGRGFESRVVRSIGIPSSGMIKQEGTEITVRDRGKRQKDKKKE